MFLLTFLQAFLLIQYDLSFEAFNIILKFKWPKVEFMGLANFSISFKYSMNEDTFLIILVVHTISMKLTAILKEPSESLVTIHINDSSECLIQLVILELPFFNATGCLIKR